MTNAGQRPVPVWAVGDEPPLDINSDDLPSFLLPNDAEATIGSVPSSPSSQKNSSRWNNAKHYKPSSQDSSTDVSLKENVDPTILETYELDSKWENRMEDQQEKVSGLPSLESIKIKLINNLSSNPYFPIFFRGSAAIFSVITLGLACEVFHLSGSNNYTSSYSLVEDNQVIAPNGRASATIYTIVISCLSIVYNLFMLWDETFGQPLGLRPSHTKLQYVFFDLILLCLQAGNAAASFDALIDRNWICPKMVSIKLCKIHKAVISFIIVTLVTHSITFLVSAFRMIHRATH